MVRSSLWGCLMLVREISAPQRISRSDLTRWLQLQQEDKAGQLWNMVGFQTNLRWGEQKRVFQLIPGLTDAEFVRLGVMHRNTLSMHPSCCNRHCNLSTARLC